MAFSSFENVPREEATRRFISDPLCFYEEDTTIEIGPFKLTAQRYSRWMLILYTYEGQPIDLREYGYGISNLPISSTRKPNMLALEVPLHNNEEGLTPSDIAKLPPRLLKLAYRTEGDRKVPYLVTV